MELLYILLLPTWQEEMKAKKEKGIFSDNTSQFCDIGLREKKKTTSFLSCLTHVRPVLQSEDSTLSKYRESAVQVDKPK